MVCIGARAGAGAGAGDGYLLSVGSYVGSAVDGKPTLYLCKFFMFVFPRPPRFTGFATITYSDLSSSHFPTYFLSLSLFLATYLLRK